MSKPWDSKLVREMLTRIRLDGGLINADDYRPDGLEKIYGMGSDGLYRLSDTQAQEILQMRLQRLTGLEQDKIVAEYKEVMTEIDDRVDQLFIANTHDYILCFSNRGRLYWLKVWEVPQGSRGSRGRLIINMFP